MELTEEDWAESRRITKQIKDGVLALHEKGIRLFYKWNAGGDSCPCWPVTEPQAEIDLELSDMIRTYVVDALELPHDGDHYNKGNGEIFFTAENALAIRFTSEDAQDVRDEELPPDEPGYMNHEIELEDVGGVKKFLDKGNISLDLEVDWEGRKNFSLHFRTQEGDAPFLMPNEEDYYISTLLPYTEPYTKYFRIDEKGNFGGRVKLTCRLIKSQKASITVYCSYQHITEFTNKEIILLP
jgi:hypothetical protein